MTTRSTSAAILNVRLSELSKHALATRAVVDPATADQTQSLLDALNAYMLDTGVSRRAAAYAAAMAKVDVRCNRCSTATVARLCANCPCTTDDKIAQYLIDRYNTLADQLDVLVQFTPSAVSRESYAASVQRCVDTLAELAT